MLETVIVLSFMALVYAVGLFFINRIFDYIEVRAQLRKGQRKLQKLRKDAESLTIKK